MLVLNKIQMLFSWGEKKETVLFFGVHADSLAGQVPGETAKIIRSNWVLVVRS